MTDKFAKAGITVLVFLAMAVLLFGVIVEIGRGFEVRAHQILG